MSLQKYIFKGSYIFSEGKFYPTGDMETINKMRRDMKLLGDNGPCNYGFFLFNPQDGTYWHDIEQENYDTELKLVDRDYIEKNFPTVECDNLVDVDW
jgi:hypothetical protein